MNQPDLILTIIVDYLTLFLSVGTASLIILGTGLYFIFRKPAHQVQANTEIDTLSAFAGGDVFTSQLDLARAFIESDRKQSAKNILKFVIKRGNTSQQQEAKRLMKAL